MIIKKSMLTLTFICYSFNIKNKNEALTPHDDQDAGRT